VRWRWPSPTASASSSEPPASNQGRSGGIPIPDGLAALPDPNGVDRGHETVTLINTTARDIDPTGWHLADAADGNHTLTRGAAGQITLGSLRYHG
jgi:hypothetical protein